MVPLTALWLPILVSAVLVFIASNILWMALPFWHRRDYGRVPDDRAFIDAAKPLRSGMYIFPFMDWKGMTPEKKAELATLPAGYMLIRNPNRFNFGVTLLGYFLYSLVVSTLAAYLAGCVFGAGEPYPHVFRIVGTAGMLAWAFGVGNISDSLWYGKPWSSTIKTIIDGVIYGLLMGGTFGWLWPR
jgi:hypothetical protein